MVSGNLKISLLWCRSELTFVLYSISLTIVDTPGFGDNIDNERWYETRGVHLFTDDLY